MLLLDMYNYVSHYDHYELLYNTYINYELLYNTYIKKGVYMDVSRLNLVCCVFTTLQTREEMKKF